MPVDLSASIYAEYKRARKRAEEAERRSSPAEAAAAYRQAAEWMRRYAEGYAHDPTVRRQRLQRADALENAAKRLEGMPPASRSAARTDTPKGVGEPPWVASPGPRSSTPSA